MASETRTDVKILLQNILDNEIVMAYTQISDNPSNKSGIIVIPVRNRTATEGQIMQWLSSYAGRRGQSLSDLSVALGNDNSLYAYRFPYPSILSVWLGHPFRSINTHYIAFWENNLILAPGTDELTDYYRNMLAGETLSRNIQYQRFMQNVETRANITIFVDLRRAFNLGKEIFDPPTFRKLNAERENISNIRYANWQVVKSKDIFYNHITINYDNTTHSATKGDEIITLSPGTVNRLQLVLNQENRRHYDILAQDAKNILHLFSTSGNLFWSIDLPEPIISRIYQIDVHKNGRLQFLFNTRDRIYLIDRNGNNVSPFPVKLPTEATNGMAVFDYNRTRDYRIFLATKDRKVMLYNGQGEVVEGWTFGTTRSEVTTPIQYIRVAGRDHIVFKDKNNVYIQDRQGHTRVPVRLSINYSDNPLVMNTTGKPKIIATDTRGQIYYLYFDGEYEIRQAGAFSSRHFFTAADLSGNGKTDFIFSDGNQFTVVDETGNRLFSERIRQGLSHLPEIYTTEGKNKKIAAVSSGNNRIYLFNSDGSQHPGFPVNGSSRSFIGKFDEKGNHYHMIYSNTKGEIYVQPLN
jgi:hypothetical protein